MHTRNLREEDRIGWISMRTKLWPEAPIDELISESFAITDEDWLKKSKIRYKVFVLESENNKLLGFIEVSIKCDNDSQSSKMAGFIKGLYVESSVRKCGYGKKLVEDAEMWTIEMGCSEMLSETSANRIAGIEAYRALGYVMTYKDNKIIRLKKQLFIR